MGEPVPLMDLDELELVLTQIGWSSLRLWKQCCVHPWTARRWLSGEHKIPEPIAVWLRFLAAVHLDTPSPLSRKSPPYQIPRGRAAVAARAAKAAAAVGVMPPDRPVSKSPRRRVRLAPKSPDAINADAPVATPRVRPMVADEPFRVGQDDTLRYRKPPRPEDPWD